MLVPAQPEREDEEEERVGQERRRGRAVRCHFGRRPGKEARDERSRRGGLGATAQDEGAEREHAVVRREEEALVAPGEARPLEDARRFPEGRHIFVRILPIRGRHHMFLENRLDIIAGAIAPVDAYAGAEQRA